MVSHRGKRLNNFTQLMKIDDPKINRSIEQFMEKTVIMNIYVAPDVGKGYGRLIIQGEKKPLDKQQRLMKDSTAESDKTRTEIDD